MHLTLLAQALWATGFIEHVSLLLVLIVRGRWRTFPMFTSWIAFLAAKTLLLFAMYRFAGISQYDFAYWSAEIIDLVMQIVIVFEMARIVLKPTDTWVRDARRMFLLFAASGAVIAVVVAYAVSPTAPNSLDTWVEKGNLFSVMLVLELFLSMGFASTQLGLVWRNHIMGLATGWAAWAVVDFFVEGAYSYLGPDWHGVVLDQIRIIAYQAATIYWIIIFWLPEPKSRKLSPEMQSYLSGLIRK